MKKNELKLNALNAKKLNEKEMNNVIGGEFKSFLGIGWWSGDGESCTAICWGPKSNDAKSTASQKRLGYQ